MAWQQRQGTQQPYTGYPQGYPGPPQGYPGVPQQPGYPQGYPGVPQQPGYPQGYPGFNQPPGSTALPMFDSEADDQFAFTDKSVRAEFIRKVYSILTVQIVVTTLIVGLFTFHEGIKQYALQRPALYWVAFVIMIAVYLVLACCGEVRRKFPVNFICLAVFTLAEGFILGMISIHHRQDTVFIAAVITALVTAGLTAFAFQTSCDFTAIGGILCAASIILVIFGIVCLFFPGRTMILIYASGGALLFSIYIVYDTQMMMGGSHKYSISPEEYIFAALNIYMDIVLLFMYILTILGILKDD